MIDGGASDRCKRSTEQPVLLLPALSPAPTAGHEKPRQHIMITRVKDRVHNVRKHTTLLAGVGECRLHHLV